MNLLYNHFFHLIILILSKNASKSILPPNLQNSNMSKIYYQNSYDPLILENKQNMVCNALLGMADFVQALLEDGC